MAEVKTTSTEIQKHPETLSGYKRGLSYKFKDKKGTVSVHVFAGSTIVALKNKLISKA
jgi:hypothetical protein